MSRSKSENLFHFTKNIEFLKSILNHGIRPRYCLEDQEWFNLDFHIAYPMCCFCDIPLSRINDHTEFYGAYGIGLTKSWGIKNNLNPVVYCPSNGLAPSVANFLLNKNRDKDDEETDEQKEKREVAFFSLLKIIKPISGVMIMGGRPVKKDFYLENEWRYTPTNEIGDSVILQEDFDREKDERNKLLEETPLTFTPLDIKYIFVESDEEIPEMVDFINNNLDSWPLSDLKILTSRITSLSTISNDL
jgi:hypothetical protein